MADNPTEQFERKVIIALEATMRGVKDTLTALEDMKKHLGNVETSTRATDAATAALSRTYTRTAKDINKLTGGFKSLKKVQRGLYETMRRVGSITRTALGTATVAAGAFLVETKRIGDTLLKFEVSSLNAAKALNTLGDAYGSLKSQSNSAILSMQDIAAELTKFQKQGIAQMSATMQKEFVAGWKGIQGVVTQLVGKSNASDLMNNFVQSLGDEFKRLKSSIGGELGGIAQQIEEAVNPQIKSKLLSQAIEELKDLRKYTNDQGTATQLLIGHMTRLQQVTLGQGSDSTKAIVAVNAAVARFGTTLENLSTRIITTFGPHLATLIDNFRSQLKGPLGSAIDYVGTVAEALNKQFTEWGGAEKLLIDLSNVVKRMAQEAEVLKAKFIAWGGTEKLIKTLGRAMEFAYDTLISIGKAAAYVGTWFLEANTPALILAGTLGAMVLAPGLASSIFLLAKGLRLVAIEGAAAAAATQGLSMAGIAGKLGGGALVVGAAGLGHLGGKAVGGYVGADKGGLADALSGAAGAAVTGAMVGSVIPGIGTAVGAAIGGVGSLIVTAISSWGDDTAEAMKKIQPPKIDSAVSKELVKVRKELEKLKADRLEQIAKGLEEAAEAAKKTNDSFVEFVDRLKELETFAGRTLPGFTAAIGGMVAVIDSLGPATEFFGEKISDIVQSISSDQMKHGFDVLRESAKAAAIELEQIHLANINKNAADAARHVRLLGDVMKVAEQATKALQQSLEAALQPLQKQVELITAIKDLRQLDLDISQQLYGTPALAVQAQLELIKTMQAEKETLEAQLATTQRIVAQQKALGATEKDIFFLRMKELDLSKKIKGVTRDQLRQVKELRDGYIDAVTAEALGAGIFAKVLISQDQNLMRGLQKGAVKRNFLLGQFGADASETRADPYRFSAQGMGFLETLSGQTMRPEDIAKAVYDRVANISDPLSKASALQSADIFMNIVSGADKNTKDLGQIFMLGQDRVVDAINALAEKRIPRAAAGLALKGVPAGETLVGAAFDRAGRGLALPPPTTGLGGVPFDAASYRKQAEQQGSARASIRALTEHYGQAAKTLDLPPAAPTRQIDPGKANTFFEQALPFYKRFESLLAAIAEGLGVDVTTVQNITVIGGKPVAGLDMSTLSVRGAGQVGLRQAVPGDSGASKQLIDDLRRSDREVKSHERAHARVAGPFAKGSPNYIYKQGPDGRRYAVGGEVLVDLSPIPGDPQATISKMRKIRQAALAPRHPSDQDLAVAQHASQMERRIKASLGPGGMGPGGIGVMAQGSLFSGKSVSLSALAGSISLGASPVVGAIAVTDPLALLADAIKDTAKAQNKAKTIFEAVAKDQYRIRDIPKNLQQAGRAVIEGGRAVEKGTRAYRAGQAVRGAPGRAVEAGKSVGRAGQAVARGAGRTYEFVRTADIGKGLKTGAQATGRGIVAGAKGAGGLLRGVGSKFILAELAYASAKATFQAKQLQKQVEALPKSIALANQDKQGRDLGQRFERLIASSEIRTRKSSEQRDEMVKQRQSLDRMMLGLAPALAQEGFEQRSEVGGDRGFGIPFGPKLGEWSIDSGLTGGIQQRTIDTIKKRRAAIQKQLDKYDKGIVGGYNDYVAQLNKTVSDMQKRSPDADMSDLENKFNKTYAEMTQFIGDLISDVQGKNIADISDSSNKLLKKGTEQLLTDLDGLVDAHMKFDAAPDNETKAALARASKRVSTQAGLVRVIGGTEAVNRAIDDFAKTAQEDAGERIIAITKQIDSLMQGVSPQKMPDNIKKQVEELTAKRANIQLDFGRGVTAGPSGASIEEPTPELSKEELDLIGPHIDALKVNLAAYAEAVQSSAIAGPDQKPEIEKLVAGIENNISDLMSKMGHVFGNVPALDHVTKAIQESQTLSMQKFDEQKAKYEQQISKLKSVRVDAAPQFHGQIQSQIDEIQSKINAIPTALTSEFKNIKERASTMLASVPQITEGTKEVSADISEQAKKYIEHLQSLLGKDIHMGDFNMSELKSAQDTANAIYNTWLKQGEELKKTGKLHADQQESLWKAYGIIQKMNQASADHQARTEVHDRQRQALSGREKMIQEEIANIKLKLPPKEIDALKKIEADRAQGKEITRDDLEKKIPEILKISDLQKKAFKRDGAKAPERKEGQTREDYKKARHEFRSKRELESQLSASKLEDIFGDDKWRGESANIANAVRTALGEGTQIPGQLDRRIGSMAKSLESREGDLAELRTQRAGLDAADAFANMSSSMKDLMRASTQAVSPGRAAGAGGLGGALGALLSDDKSIGNIINKAFGGAQQATILKGGLAFKGPQSLEEALGVSGTRYKAPDFGTSALPGGMPILTAVDTDEFTKPRDMSRYLREKYGSRAEPMVKGAQGIKDLEERIRKIDQQLKGSDEAAGRGPFGVGPKDLHGFEIPGVTEVSRGGAGMSKGRRKTLQSRKEALDTVLKKRFARIQKMRESAEKVGGVKQSQFEKDRIEKQARKQQAAAEAVLGTGYTGDAPERVTPTGQPIPKSGLPSTGPQPPDVVRGKQAPVRAPTRVPDPTRVRQLDHGSGGNWQSKGKGVKKILQQAGQIIEEMGTEMDRFNEDQDNITQYAGNRLFNVQAVSP